MPETQSKSIRQRLASLRRYVNTSPKNYVAASLFSAVLLILSILAFLQEGAVTGYHLPVTVLLSLLAGLLMHLKLLPRRKFESRTFKLSSVPRQARHRWAPCLRQGTNDDEKHIGIGEILRHILSSIGAIAIPCLAVLLLQNFTADPWRLYPKMFAVNLLFFYLIYLTLTFLTGSFQIGYSIATSLFLIIGIANYFVMQFRSSPIVPWDLFSLRTAASVADNYSYDIKWKFTWTAIGFAYLLICGMKISWKIRPRMARLCVTVCTAGLFVFCVAKLQEKDVKDSLGMDQTLFTPAVRYRNNGFLAAFLGNIHLINVQKPEGYSVEKVEEIQASIQTEGEERDELAGFTEQIHADNGDLEWDEERRYPNIIIIMNEAFSDLQVRGSFGVDHDYMPYFRSLMEEGVGGHLMVSVKGGNTANTEYEFLSGDTMAFLPAGSVVYQQFIHGEVPALPTYLSQLGYETTAIHPYNASGWDRDTVYPWLGFDTFLSLKNFTNPVKVRDYVSDKSAFDKIIEVFEKSPDTPKFIFEVTMQNHSGYSKEFPGFEETVHLTGLSYENTQTKAVQKYLTLIEKSDQALEEMMQYFETVEEPTIIVMFGDHQPSDYITNVIDRMTGYDPDSEDLEEAQKSYLVPYFVWNNFGMEMEERELTSVNYLAADLLEAAQMPLTQYQQFLLQLQKTLPVICAGTYLDADGRYYAYGEESHYSSTCLSDYNILEYNHLTDDRHRVDELFLGAQKT